MAMHGMAPSYECNCPHSALTAAFFSVHASSHMGRPEVNPEERESLSEQRSLGETFQEGASSGANQSSADGASEEESKTPPPLDDGTPEVENNSKFTGTDAILTTTPVFDALLGILTFDLDFKC